MPIRFIELMPLIIRTDVLSSDHFRSGSDARAILANGLSERTDLLDPRDCRASNGLVR